VDSKEDGDQMSLLGEIDSVSDSNVRVARSNEIFVECVTTNMRQIPATSSQCVSRLCEKGNLARFEENLIDLHQSD